MKLRHAALLAGGAAAAVAVAAMFRRGPVPAAAPGVIRLIDDEAIHYIDRGEGPAIVFLHGFCGSTYSWRFVLDNLSRDHRVVALDFPGFGFSERNERMPLGHDDHARRVARLMEALGIDQAAIVGHSMGGAIAQRLATTYPERVERLVLVAAVNAAGRETWERASQRLRGMYTLGPIIERNSLLIRYTVRSAMRQMAYDTNWVTTETVNEYSTQLGRPGTARCLVRLAVAARDEQPVDLRQITAPTLVISGARDNAVAPSIGRDIAAAIPGAHHIVMENAGHLLPEEAPERFQALLVAFLAGAIPAEESPSR